MSPRTAKIIERAGFFAALTIGASLTFTRPARAERPASSRAHALFDQGRQLAEQGHYDEACAKFVASYKVEIGLGTEFNLADCWEHVGKIELARTLFLDVAQQSRERGERQRAEVARARADALSSAPPPSAAPVVAAAEPPQIESVPEVVVKAPEPERAPSSPEPAKEPQAEASPPAKLREEYGVLADAASRLRALQQALARLASTPQGAARARELAQDLARARRELDACFALAGQMAGHVARQAAWSGLASPAAKAPRQAAKPRQDAELASATAQPR